MDYGLLHFQLATPVFAFALLLIVMFLMNKWLFQPVFRTLNNRDKILDDGKAEIASVNAEVSRLTQEYETQLSAARKEVSDSYASARKEAQAQRDELLQKVRAKGEEELEKGKNTLQDEIKVAKEQLEKMTDTLAGLTSKTLLN